MNPTGRVFFWKYKTDEIHGEWHCTADADGCTNLISCLDQMAKSDSPRNVEMELTPVDMKILRLPDYNSPHVSMEKLFIRYDPAAANFNEWQIVQNGPRAEITIGKRMLDQLSGAVADLMNHSPVDWVGINEDYAIFFWDSDQ